MNYGQEVDHPVIGDHDRFCSMRCVGYVEWIMICALHIKRCRNAIHRVLATLYDVRLYQMADISVDVYIQWI